MALIDYNNEGSVATFVFGGGTKWYAQTFTASSSYNIGSVKLRMNRALSPGTVTVSIRATSGGLPIGGDLASGTTDGDTLPEEPSEEWRLITFSSSTALVSGTKYAIVVRSVANYSQWALEDPGDYAGGDACDSLDSGSSWGLV